MNILYVEDDPGIGHLLGKHLRSNHHKTTVVGGVVAANVILEKDLPEVLLCDQNLPDGTGLELMKAVLKEHSKLPCIMLTGVGSENLAVEAMKAGARDYIVKDIENDFLSKIPQIIDQIAKEQLLNQTKPASQHQTLPPQFEKELVVVGRNPSGKSSNFSKLLKVVEQVAPTDATVLLTGESGTGKEVIAQLTHNLSSRAARPFVAVNCSALPAELIESELFGHEKGAFTGASSLRMGRFEIANGGTLFLDEIGDLPFDLQAKLLRVLEESTFQRVGSNKTLLANVRIIAATNHDLVEKIKQKGFREDLYYRLNVIPILIPPLRERDLDIELLFNHFVNHFKAHHDIEPPLVSAETLASINEYRWPGNIRELRNYVERAVIIQEWGDLTLDDSLSEESAIDSSSTKLTTLAEMERKHILRTLLHTDGVIAGNGGAAQLLDLNPNTLRSRMKKLGIGKPRFKP